MEKINLAEKLSLFKEQWNPKVVGELNGQLVKVAKFKGPFVWHHHDDEDELFYVVKGRFDMEFQDIDQFEKVIEDIRPLTEHLKIYGVYKRGEWK